MLREIKNAIYCIASYTGNRHFVECDSEDELAAYVAEGECKDTIRLNQDYRDAEVPVTLKIIAGYRHDILHDACAENVYDDIYRFIQAES